MRTSRVFACLVATLLLALPAFAQGIPTGSITGKVTTEGQPAPGVTVTVTSPALQGQRSTTTGAGGDYHFSGLPPGDYQSSFDIEGLQSVHKTARDSAAQGSVVDAALAMASVSEEIVVVGEQETISTQSLAATTMSKKTIEELPVERNIRETVLLTPGVGASGPGTNRTTGRAGLSIEGSQSYENLFLVNGVVVTENLRGQPFDLFIEDAIQETTVSTASVSAEYGRFAGGVVNVLTRSGSNEFKGSFRTAFTNQSWEAETPLTTAQTDKTNKRYEATLGGYLWKDKAWFFVAGRDFEELTSAQTTRTLVPYDKGTDQQRFEGKLNLALLPSQRLTGSYIKIDEDDLGNVFGTVLDTRSINDRQLPQELMAVNYNGNFGSAFLAEAQYSKRKFTFENAGSKFTDLINGTLLVDSVTGDRWWSPTFCGVCRPEKRDNENFLVKGSWFLSTQNLGAHDLVAGYDSYKDIRVSDNHQSGSDYRILITSTIIRGSDLFPQLVSGNSSTFIQYNPILQSSLGTDFVTNSYFVNDRWRLNDHWSFSVGLRYDDNDGKDASGTKVAKDSKLSPRLSGAWDPKGDGDWTFHAGYGQYVTAIASTQANGSALGGNPATITWFYRGDSINPDPNAASLTPADAALRQIFAWFDAQGGVNNTSNLRSLNIPGATTRIQGSLDSPFTTEYTVGTSKRIGARGLARVDYVHREGHDFYVNRTDLQTGSTVTPSGQRANVTLIENEDSLLERKYDGLQTQAQYRISDRLTLAGNYTLSHTRGNVDGETAASGPVGATVRQFPEYKDFSWNNPSGDLLVDQRHRANLWAIFQLLHTNRHELSLSLLERYSSGQPYGAVGLVDARPYVTNPGYAVPPASVTYYYTARDAFHTDAISSTDLSANYTFHWGAWGRDIEVYLQPEMINVFDEHGALFVNQGVQDPTTTASLARFNPFTETPVEGVNWRKGPTFGKPTTDLHYQQPRTFRFSVGFRF
jgi:outer membrane receptor for ferrienterochelin and colicin